MYACYGGWATCVGWKRAPEIPGLELPDSVEIPTITGRIVCISAQIANDDDFPIRQYDKVLFNPKNAIPVDFEGDNRLFVIPVEDVVAVFRKE